MLPVVSDLRSQLEVNKDYTFLELVEKLGKLLKPEEALQFYRAAHKTRPTDPVASPDDRIRYGRRAYLNDILKRAVRLGHMKKKGDRTHRVFRLKPPPAAAVHPTGLMFSEVKHWLKEKKWMSFDALCKKAAKVANRAGVLRSTKGPKTTATRWTKDQRFLWGVRRRMNQIVQQLLRHGMLDTRSIPVRYEYHLREFANPESADR